MLVVGLDPSTDITGMAAGYFSPTRLEIVSTDCTHQFKMQGSHSSLTQRLYRISRHREEIEEWLRWLGSEVEGVAYEMHTGRNREASNALSQAAGSYLTIPDFVGKKVWEINSSTAKKVWAGQAFKGEECKAKVVQWANNAYGLKLGPEQDAEADAVAVLLAAWQSWRAEQSKTLRLTGPRGGKL